MSDMPSADRIRAFRQAYGLTQEKLAERLGVDVLSIDAWECEEREPPAMLWGILQRLSMGETVKGDLK